jgi:ubiquinone/menaquinone biosynthesis C-methylase UbiE
MVHTRHLTRFVTRKLNHAKRLSELTLIVFHRNDGCPDAKPTVLASDSSRIACAKRYGLHGDGNEPAYVRAAVNREPRAGMSRQLTADVLTRHDRRPRAENHRIYRFTREVHHILLDQVPFRAWNRVLYVESGDGWPAEEAWRRMGRGYVCGVDASSTMTDLARRLRGVDGRLEFQRWDVGKLAFADGWFDTVISSFAFHRYVDPVAPLLEMHRVLRPRGNIYILEPDRMSFGGLFALWDYYFRLTDPGHVRYYTPGDILRLLERSGFAQGRQLHRYQRLLRGGKLLASAVFLNAQRPS